MEKGQNLSIDPPDSKFYVIPLSSVGKETYRRTDRHDLCIML